MKKIVACVISVLIFVFLCTSCSKAPTEVPSSVEYSVFAEEVYVDGKVYNVQSVIEEILAGYDMVPTYQAQIKHGGYEDICKNIRIYSDRYYIGYWASDDFLDELLYLDENGFNSKLFGDMERIYIPVFADVNGEERVISNAYLYYDYKECKFKLSNFVLTKFDEAFLNKEHMELYEKILFLMEENGWSNCVLVSDYIYHHEEPILLTEADGIYGAYDYNNIFFEFSLDFEETWYDIDDYAAKRKDYIATHESQYPSLLSIPFVRIAITVIIVSIAAITTAIVIHIRKKKKKNRKKTRF